MRGILILSTILLLSTSAASAEVVIERFSEPLVAAHGARAAPPNADVASPSLFGGSPTARGNTPAGTLWFIAGFKIDDSLASGERTLFSVRNARTDADDVNVTVQYYDEFFDLQATEPVVISKDALTPFSVRDVPELVIPGGVSRGLIRISQDGLVAVDVFQLDPSQNFATGEVALVTADFCTNWLVRFLTFGGDSGTRLLLLINGPQGAAAEDPTLVGEIYDQQGTFVNGFSIKTDEWIFEIDAQELVIGEALFGSIKLTIDAKFIPAGTVRVRHSAFGKFSVALPAFCTDPEPA